MNHSLNPECSRRQLVAASTVAAVGASTFTPVAQANPNKSAQIVKSNNARAVILIPASADIHVKLAADEIVEAVRRSTGTTLQIMSQPPKSKGLTVIVLDQAASPDEKPRLADVGRSGFRITSSRRRVAIVGATSTGTRMGAYEFCERFVGVRWLFPGELGVDVPTSRDIDVPLGVWNCKPAFEHRSLSPWRWFDSNVDDPAVAWGNRARVEYVHGHESNLWSIVPAAKYADPTKDTFREDFYPIILGKRYLPKPGAKSSWEPRLTAPGIVDAAVQSIREDLQAHPELTTYSLGMNDSGRWSDDEVDPYKRNFLGYPDMSEIYWRFINDVVGQLEDEFPHVEFGALAYQHVTEPPSFPVNPRVCVFICLDRHRWNDLANRALDQDLTLRWLRRTPNVGWYDYYEDSAYPAPRPTVQSMIEAYRWAHEAGVKHIYAELYPNFAAGPVAWVAGRLLWEPDRNWRRELDDWYRRMVGPDAMGPVRRYFELWEDFWTTTIKEAPWYPASRVYLSYKDANWLASVPESLIQESRTLLEQAQRAGGSPLHKQRLSLIVRMFEYFENSWRSFPRSHLRNAETESEVFELWNDTVARTDASIAAAKRRLDLLDEFEPDPALFVKLNPARTGHVWDGWDVDACFAVAEYLRANEADGGPITDAVRAAAEATSANVRQLASWTLASVAGMTNLARHSGFEDPVRALKSWVPRPDDQTVDSIEVTDEMAYSGERSVKVPAGSLTVFAQGARVTDDRPVRVNLSFCCPRPKRGFMVQIWNQWFTPDRKISLANCRRLTFNPQMGEKDWFTMHYTEVPPAGAGYLTCRIMVVTDSDVYLDDAEIWTIKD